MDYSKFTKKSLEAIESSNDIARENNNTQICQEHLFYALLMQDDGIATEILKGLNVNANELVGDIKGKIDRLAKSSGQTQSYISNDLNNVFIEARNNKR